ncbi:RNA 2',3'-cyclic phosphodiesterase [Thermosediminibacter oceani]|uniref:RNA 2',3'-cyclic phosphodiesterase n=1 Tax=Thermosediminibacter oceani (strain ATCC BAA-1034 / DSM 16646 / JW/IW-1228P) TaxID=555079 RepID=D9S3J6_THEOJ|nr:RNA 2',3'-cyclic phosphodiesterase [Thermosediminibacter oceani]ADL07973.1 2'-5' RNA ligase [Thermosediminibacter oceani DSM 16646]
MNSIRCFISIELDPATRKSVSQFVDKLKFLEGIKWVSEENYHITLAFMGELPVDKVPLVCDTLNSISARHRPFILNLHGSGFFPNTKNPKVFWIGIEKSDELYRLREDIDKTLRALNIDFDPKPFSPHLTIGRIKSRLDPSLIPREADFSVSFTVKELYFMKSQLFKEGPVYTEIFRVELKGLI